MFCSCNRTFGHVIWQGKFVGVTKLKSWHRIIVVIVFKTQLFSDDCQVVKQTNDYILQIFFCQRNIVPVLVVLFMLQIILCNPVQEFSFVTVILFLSQEMDFFLLRPKPFSFDRNCLSLKVKTFLLFLKQEILCCLKKSFGDRKVILVSENVILQQEI